MRELKFRAFCKTEPALGMSGPFEVGDVALWISMNSHSARNVSDCEVMQFTGMVDRGGGDVYEGDILEDGIGFRYHVTFNNGCFQHEDSGLLLDELLEFGRVVVGNIYENPELLKGIE